MRPRNVIARLEIISRSAPKLDAPQSTVISNPAGVILDCTTALTSPAGWVDPPNEGYASAIASCVSGLGLASSCAR